MSDEKKKNLEEQMQSDETVEEGRETRGSNPDRWTREQFIEAYQEAQQQLSDSEQSAKGLQSAIRAQESTIEAAIATLMDDIEECPSEGLDEPLAGLAKHTNHAMRTLREAQAKNRRYLLDHKRFEKEGVALRQENLTLTNERDLLLEARTELQNTLSNEVTQRKLAESNLAELMREGGGKKKLEKLTASLHKALDEVSKLKTQNQSLKGIIDELHKEKEPPTRGELRKANKEIKRLQSELAEEAVSRGADDD